MSRGLIVLAFSVVFLTPIFAQDEIDLERLDGKFTRQLEAKLPGWKHERGEPMAVAHGSGGAAVPGRDHPPGGDPDPRLRADHLGVRLHPRPPVRAAGGVLLPRPGRAVLRRALLRLL